MSIAEQNSAQIERLKTIIANAFTKCSAKKATMPTDRKIANLPDCIDSIVVPSGTKPEVITTNGEHNVKEYEFAQVNVQPKTQSKNVSPAVAAQTFYPDSGYDGFYQFTVNGIKTYYNTYTPTSNLQDITIDFGFVPKMIAIITCKSIVRDSTYSFISSWVWENVTSEIRQRVNYVCSTSVSSTNTGVTQGAGTGSFPSSLSGTKFTWKLSASTATNYKFRFKSGSGDEPQYYVFAWGV